MAATSQRPAAILSALTAASLVGLIVYTLAFRAVWWLWAWWLGLALITTVVVVVNRRMG